MRNTDSVRHFVEGKVKSSGFVNHNSNWEESFYIEDKNDTYSLDDILEDFEGQDVRITIEVLQ